MSAWRVIREAWGMGYVDVQPVRSVAAVCYCLKYVTKSRIENMLDDSGLLSVVHKDNFLLVSKGFGAPDLQQIRFCKLKLIVFLIIPFEMVNRLLTLTHILFK